MRHGVNRTATPAPHTRLDRWKGLDFSVSGERRGHLDFTGQQVWVGRVRRRRCVFVRVVRVRWRGCQHHAVELGDVGSEAVHNAADLIHQRALGPSRMVVHSDQTAITPNNNRAAAGGSTTAATAATADTARVLWNGSHLRLLDITCPQPLADRADWRRCLWPIGDRVALLRFREIIQGLVCDRVGMTRQGGHGGEGGKRDMRGQPPPSTVTFLRSLGEGLDDGSLIVLLLLDVEGQPLPQVAAA